MLKLDEPADQVLNSARLPGSFVREQQQQQQRPFNGL